MDNDTTTTKDLVSSCPTDLMSEGPTLKEAVSDCQIVLIFWGSFSLKPVILLEIWEIMGHTL